MNNNQNYKRKLDLIPPPKTFKSISVTALHTQMQKMFSFSKCLLNSQLFSFHVYS